MKQKDIAMLILIVSISLAVSYYLGNAFLNTEENRTATLEIVNPITTEFPPPDPDVFNKNAVNTIDTIEISESDTDEPFKDN